MDETPEPRHGFSFLEIDPLSDSLELDSMTSTFSIDNQGRPSTGSHVQAWFLYEHRSDTHNWGYPYRRPLSRPRYSFWDSTVLNLWTAYRHSLVSAYHDEHLSCDWSTFTLAPAFQLRRPAHSSKLKTFANQIPDLTINRLGTKNLFHPLGRWSLLRSSLLWWMPQVDRPVPRLDIVPTFTRLT